MRPACLPRLSLIALPLLAFPAFAETPLEAALAAPTEGPTYRFDLRRNAAGSGPCGADRGTDLPV